MSSNPTVLKKPLSNQIYTATFNYYFPTIGKLLKYHLIDQNYQILVIGPVQLIKKSMANAKAFVKSLLDVHVGYYKALKKALS